MCQSKNYAMLACLDRGATAAYFYSIPEQCARFPVVLRVDASICLLVQAMSGGQQYATIENCAMWSMSHGKV